MTKEVLFSTKYWRTLLLFSCRDEISGESWEISEISSCTLNTEELFCYSLAEMKFLENPERSLKFHLCKISISGDWTDLTFPSVNTAFCKMSLCPHMVSSYSSKFCLDNSPLWLQLFLDLFAFQHYFLCMNILLLYHKNIHSCWMWRYIKNIHLQSLCETTHEDLWLPCVMEMPHDQP